MTIHELIKLAIKKLEKSKSTSPALDGEVLLSHVLDRTREYLMTNPDKTIPPKLEQKYLTLISRRILGWPAAYLTKQKEFYRLNFYVDKNVLIPRPETEGLVELAINAIKDLKLRTKNRKPLRILDLGTGSGCIIISLAKNLNPKSSNLQLFASDISPQAIIVARKNSKRHKVKIKFADGHLLQPWGRQTFDVIVANLPYLKRRTDPSTKFEPTGALIAAKKGLKLYEQLFRQVTRLKIQPSLLLLEIGRDQGRLIKKLADKYLPAYQTKIFRDLSGRIRYAILAKKSS